MSWISRLFRPRDPKPPPGSGWRVDGPVRGRWRLWNDTALMGTYTHRERAVAELMRQQGPGHLTTGRLFAEWPNGKVLPFAPAVQDEPRNHPTDESGHSAGFEVGGGDFASGPDTSARIVRGGGGAGSILAPTPDYDAVDLTRAHVESRSPTPITDELRKTMTPRYGVAPAPPRGRWFVTDRGQPLGHAYSHKSNATRAARKLNEAHRVKAP